MGKFQSSGSKKIGDLDKALVSYRGTTTDDGGALGTTLICSALITRPEFNGNQVVIIDGSCAGQARDINGTTLAGTVTPLSAFDAQITEGTKFVITAIRPTPAEVAAIEAKLDGASGLAAIKAVIDAILVDTSTTLEAKLDKLAGAAPVSGQVSANWNTATGTSTEPGEDLITFGANDTKYKLHSFLINVSALTVGAIITVKLFMQVHGTERKVYSQSFTVGTDTDGLWIVNGTVGIHEALRCEVYSDTNESVAIDYDYMLEVM